jgi:hypothetical protein
MDIKILPDIKDEHLFCETSQDKNSFVSGLKLHIMKEGLKPG